MRSRLEEALAENRIVAIEREASGTDEEIGYVVSVSDALFLLLRIGDDIRFDGFSVLRIEDISDVEVPHEHEAFVESALRLRDESVEEMPAIELDDWQSAVRSAGRIYEVVTLHSETREPGVCRIGCVRSVTEESVHLVEIDPDADWEEEVSTVELAGLTRLDVGGAYEEALLLVGDACPFPILRPVD